MTSTRDHITGDSRVPVVIVGAGPVGLASALFLRNRGVPVTILEASDSLQTDMRASTFHPPTLDMLEVNGIANKLIEQGTSVAQWQYRDNDTGETIIFDLGLLADSTRHPFRLQCEQFRLTKTIVNALASDCDFDLRLNTRVVNVVRESEHISIRFTSKGGAGRIQASYLIAADGSRSTVRKALGLVFKGDTYPSTSITAVIDCPMEDLIPGLLPVNYCWTKAGQFSVMRVGSFWRVGFSVNLEQTVDEALSDENISAFTKRIVGEEAKFRIVHKGAYMVHRRVLNSFRYGRVLFAGDAAHLNSPSGGMGMNSGVHDAHLLGNLLADVLQGHGEALLDYYAETRRDIAVAEVQAASDRHHKLHRETDPQLRARNWKRLQKVAGEAQSARQYLLKSSMIQSLLRHSLAPVPAFGAHPMVERLGTVK